MDTPLLDFIDTSVKGPENFASLGLEYPVVTLLQIAFCITGMITTNERFHAVFTVGALAYQISWAVRMLETVA